jgi:hypothetical protein
MQLKGLIYVNSNQGCENSLGSFKCLCDSGYAYANGSTAICEGMLSFYIFMYKH